MTFVYMIRNSRNRLYIGISDNSKKRLFDHNHKAGADFTVHGNFKIIFLEDYPNLQEARQREIQIKKWRREKKEMLIERYKSRLPTKHLSHSQKTLYSKSFTIFFTILLALTALIIFDINSGFV
jgi:putative endonuclease